MKAKIKVNYSEINSGDIVNIIDMHEKFITVLSLGRNIDFCYSELEFLQDHNTLFEVGRKLSQLQKIGFVMSNADIDRAILTILPNLKKSFKLKCYHTFIHN